MTTAAWAFLPCVLGGVMASAAPLDTHITTAGWGPVHVGMSSTDSRLAQLRFEPVPAASGVEHCHYIQSVDVPELRVMIEAGKVVRVETHQGRYSTPSGVRVGDSEESARNVYGQRAVARPHKYLQGALYLIVYTADRDAAVVLEIVNGRVVSIRGGLIPAVEYVEGCS